MKESKPPKDQLNGLLRIHRRRPGIGKPKDSLGLSCILQENDSQTDNYCRKKKIIIPQDNIGIACLPTNEINNSRNTPPKVSESDDTKTIKIDASQENKIETDEYLTRLRGGADWTSILTSKFSNLNSNIKKHKRPIVGKNELYNTKSDIGISNIRRPNGDKSKPRKPILPKDNIGLCCRLLQKPNVKTNAMTDKKINKNIEIQSIQQTQSVPNLKGKQCNFTESKTMQKINIKDTKAEIWK